MQTGHPLAIQTINNRSRPLPFIEKLPPALERESHAPTLIGIVPPLSPVKNDQHHFSVYIYVGFEQNLCWVGRWRCAPTYLSSSTPCSAPHRSHTLSRRGMPAKHGILLGPAVPTRQRSPTRDTTHPKRHHSATPGSAILRTLPTKPASARTTLHLYIIVRHSQRVRNARRRARGRHWLDHLSRPVVDSHTPHTHPRALAILTLCVSKPSAHSRRDSERLACTHCDSPCIRSARARAGQRRVRARREYLDAINHTQIDRKKLWVSLVQ